MKRLGAGCLLVLLLLALLAPWLAPQNPYDLQQLQLSDSAQMPRWLGGEGRWLLGTDAQGRDLLSLLLYGLRLSLLTATCSVALALLIGVPIGLLAGYRGGLVERLLLRIADIQLSFPVILVALFVDGVANALLPAPAKEQIAIPLLCISLGLSQWTLLARTTRAVTQQERSKSYVEAARLYGAGLPRILTRHLLPNILPSISVIAAAQFGLAVLAESTLSFLGAGLPPTMPSLGSLIRRGNEFLLAGHWWLSACPGLLLLLLILSVNLTHDYLRDRAGSKRA